MNATHTPNGRLTSIEIASKTTKLAAKTKNKAKTPRNAKSQKLRLRIASAVGSVGVGVLGLSVVHCCEAIELLTGSPRILSGLLAIGIDAGMVSCELAELVADDKTVQRWSTAYVVTSILLSMVLNAYAFSRHAAPGMEWASIVLGATVPGLVFVLGRVAGLLARS